MGKSKTLEGEPSDNLYITGLPESFDTDSVQQFFSAIGTVTQCKSFGNGFALVRFASIEEAMTVKVSLSGQQPIGCTKPMGITFAVSQESRDWTCNVCGDLQFGKNTSCRLCGAEKGAEGDPNNPPPPGGFGKAKGNGKTLTLPLSPYGATGMDKGKGKGKDKWKGGPMCTMQEFTDELIAGGLPGGGQDPTLNCIYVGGLPVDTTQKNLYEIFACFGSIPPKGTTVEVSHTGECVGWGLVNFIESSSADMAVMALNGIMVGDKKMEVRKK